MNIFFGEKEHKQLHIVEVMYGFYVRSSFLGVIWLIGPSRTREEQK